MLLDIKSPKPVPRSDLVINFEKSFGIISGSIPLPVSLILTMTSLSDSSVSIVMTPLSVNLIALLNKLVITCVNLPLSAFKNMSLRVYRTSGNLDSFVIVSSYIGKTTTYNIA